MDMLDDEDAPIEEVCVESEEEEKMEEIEDSSEGSDKDMYTGSRIVRQTPPTVTNKKQNVKGMDF